MYRCSKTGASQVAQANGCIDLHLGKTDSITENAQRRIVVPTKTKGAHHTEKVKTIVPDESLALPI